jgi:hypothetical protein
METEEPPAQRQLGRGQGVAYLWIRLVRGSISFLPSLGSRGVRAPNCGDKKVRAWGVAQVV